jgi:hypothetical protein
MSNPTYVSALPEPSSGVTIIRHYYWAQKQHPDGSDKMADDKRIELRDFLYETQPAWTQVNSTGSRNILPTQD